MNEPLNIQRVLEEYQAHLRTIAQFGGTVDQAKELAAKGLERGYALLQQLGEPEYPQAAEVCAQLYQVIGSMASDLGVFDHPQVIKALDNASAHAMQHQDVLPFPSFEPPFQKPDLTHARIAELHIDRIRELEELCDMRKDALTAIVNYPAPEGNNMPAENMKTIAREALATSVTVGEIHLTHIELADIQRAARAEGEAKAAARINPKTEFMAVGEGYVAAWVWQDSGRVFWCSRITSAHQAAVTVNEWTKQHGPTKGIDYKVVKVLMRNPEPPYPSQKEEQQ